MDFEHISKAAYKAKQKEVLLNQVDTYLKDLDAMGMDPNRSSGFHLIHACTTDILLTGDEAYTVLRALKDLLKEDMKALQKELELLLKDK